MNPLTLLKLKLEFLKVRMAYKVFCQKHFKDFNILNIAQNKYEELVAYFEGQGIDTRATPDYFQNAHKYSWDNIQVPAKVTY